MNSIVCAASVAALGMSIAPVAAAQTPHDWAGWSGEVGFGTINASLTQDPAYYPKTPVKGQAARLAINYDVQFPPLSGWAVVLGGTLEGVLSKADGSVLAQSFRPTDPNDVGYDYTRGGKIDGGAALSGHVGLGRDNWLGYVTFGGGDILVTVTNTFDYVKHPEWYSVDETSNGANSLLYGGGVRFAVGPRTYFDLRHVIIDGAFDKRRSGNYTAKDKSNVPLTTVSFGLQF